MVSLYLMKLMVDAVTKGIAAPDKSVAFGRVAFLIGLPHDDPRIAEAARQSGADAVIQRLPSGPVLQVRIQRPSA